MTLAEKTHALRAQGRKALVAFLTAGYPDPRTFDALVRAAVAAGADVVEVGIPFSDPIADGPVIQAASAAALAGGMTLERALDAVARLTPGLGAPVVLMGYVNPVLRMGVARFARRAADAGVAGVILPDVPHEESGPFRAAFGDARLALVELVAPTSDDARLRSIAGASEGFVYLVSLTGVTGARTGAPDGLAGLVGRVRRASDTPVYVGFGISSAERAAGVAAHADGVIIGSRLLEIAAGGPPAGAADRVGGFLAGVRAALDGRS